MGGSFDSADFRATQQSSCLRTLFAFARCDDRSPEDVPGENLSQLIKPHGPLPASEAVEYIVQAAGLQAVHKAGLVHRDVKPSNLLMTPIDQVKLLDFGACTSASRGGRRRIDQAGSGVRDH